MKRFFKVELAEWPGYYFGDGTESNMYVWGEKEAEVFDASTEVGREMTENTEWYGIKIHWLPEDQQLRRNAAAELPL